MANITTIFLQYLNPRKFTFWMIFLVILLIIGAYFVYSKNYDQIMNGKKNSDVVNADSGDDIQILFFTVDWCPHCKNAKTPWNNFKKGYHNKRLGNKLITCREFNVTEKDSNDDTYQDYMVAKNMQDRYGVEGYPTIKMVRGNQVIDFDAKITTYSLEKFVENML